MEREPTDDATSKEPEQNQADEQRGGVESPSQDSDPEVEDDGSVPAKQIHRWKGEGGSWLPSD